jgi:hypothetical protein
MRKVNPEMWKLKAMREDESRNLSNITVAGN